MSTGTLVCIVLLIVVIATTYVCSYIEVVEERGCHDTMFRLTCRHLESRIAILNANFSSNVTNLETLDECNDTSLYFSNSSRGKVALDEEQTIRRYINYRCSGANHCSFMLSADHPAAADWGPGFVYIKYACFNSNVTKFCNEDILAENEGFIMSPGYPNYYVNSNDCSWILHARQGQKVQLTVLDMSLRGISSKETECTDQLQVADEERVHLTLCGELEYARTIVSQGSVLNISITSPNQSIYPKRGVLFHYKALGCPVLHSPADGYMVYRNETHAQFMCCINYVFPDTLHRTKSLHCDNGNTWNSSLPDCINIFKNKTVAENMHNTTDSQVAAVIRQADFIVDVMLPTLIICILLIGNGVILLIIFYFRRRAVPQQGDEEELGAIFEEQDGNHCDKSATRIST